ncbi:MAG TPA: hypothetical protein VFE20_04370 [Thermoleophilia bacterium]|nr:hypothetical protein [Thermoleophilia bacterium]
MRSFVAAALVLFALATIGCDGDSGPATAPAARSGEETASTGIQLMTEETGADSTPASEEAVRTAHTADTLDLEQLEDAERATVEDPAGDALPLSEAQGPAQAPLADLTSVSLVGPAGGTSLFAAFDHAQAVPTNAGEGEAGASNALLWQIQTWQGEEPIYLLEVTLRGDGYTVGAFEMSTGEQFTFATQPTVEGNRLLVEFPLDSLDELSGGFTWAAAAEWDAYYGAGPFDFDTFRDSAPDAQGAEFAQPENRVRFP